MNGLNIKGGYSIQQMQDILAGKQSEKKTESAVNGRSFEEILSELKQVSKPEVKFSKHANNRLLDRNIELTDEIKERLENGIKKAETKGINDSLVMVDNVAFIVNIKNQTVITAVAGDEEDMVFSNIDGAVIA